MTKYPKRWQDCKPFVQALHDRKYLAAGTMAGKSVMTLFMPDGEYLYMYELWQDGVEYGSTVMRKVVTRLKHRAIRNKRVIKRTRRKKT